MQILMQLIVLATIVVFYDYFLSNKSKKINYFFAAISLVLFLSIQSPIEIKPGLTIFVAYIIVVLGALFLSSMISIINLLIVSFYSYIYQSDGLIFIFFSYVLAMLCRIVFKNQRPLKVITLLSFCLILSLTAGLFFYIFQEEPLRLGESLKLDLVYVVLANLGLLLCACFIFRYKEKIYLDIKKVLSEDILMTSQFYNAEVGFILLDENYVTVKVNKHLCKLLNYDHNAFKNIDIKTFLNESDKSKIIRELVRTNTYKGDVKLIDKEGIEIPINLCLSARYEDDVPIFFIATILDLRNIRDIEKKILDENANYDMCSNLGNVPTWEWDYNSKYMKMNQSYIDTFGEIRDRNDLYSFLDKVNPSERDAVTKRILDILKNKESEFTFSFSYFNKDNQLCWTTNYGKIIYDEMNNISYVCGCYIDETENRIKELKLLTDAAVYKSGQEAFMIFNKNGIILDANNAFFQLTGLNKKKLQENNTKYWSDLSYLPSIDNTVFEFISVNQKYTQELLLKSKSKNNYTAWITVSKLENSTGDGEEYLLLISDISKHKEHIELINHQANYDFLTNLPNRQMFINYINNLVENKTPFICIYLDIDDFKNINDSFGHATGDSVIKLITLRLKSIIPDGAMLSRLSGDEFGIIVNHFEQGITLATKLKDVMRKKIECKNNVIYASMSLGIVDYPNQASNTKILLQNASHALSEAKKHGKNCYRIFDDTLKEQQKARLTLINELKEAITLKQFELFYQPIVDLKTNEIVKAEALIRWRHPVRGLIYPGAFIELVEQTGLIIEIGDWVFKEAALQQQRWQQEHNVFIQISVNKSPLQFKTMTDDTGKRIEFLKTNNIRGDAICVEITEGLLLNAESDVYEQLIAYKDAGVQLSLDDFGTGYSSFSYVSKFDLNYIKIDQSFVREFATKQQNVNLAKAIITLAKSLNMKVIAEGIETLEQLNILTKLECDYGQGYMFSKPIPADEFGSKFLKIKESI